MQIFTLKISEKTVSIIQITAVLGSLVAFGAYTATSLNTSSFEPKNVQITNVESTRAVISWETTDNTTAVVSLSDTVSNIEPIVQENNPSQKHELALDGLMPNTFYYARLTINGVEFDNNGVPYMFKTQEFIEEGVIAGVAEQNTVTPVATSSATVNTVTTASSNFTVFSMSTTNTPTPTVADFLVFAQNTATPTPSPTPTPTPANPSSSNYKLRDFAFGSGGVVGATSQNYSMMGIAGEVANSKLASANYKVKGGLPYTVHPALPPAPNLTNVNSYYDRLQIVINTASNASDTTYAVAITKMTDTNWSLEKYVQSDGTLGNVLGLEDFKTYSNWGAATGTLIYDLEQNTMYKARVKARQGAYTETEFGPEATAQTQDPYLAFGASPSSITFEELSSANNYTDNSKFTTLITSTNAYNGYQVLAYSLNPLTYLSNTIANFSATNSNPLSFTGEGFGYTTSDSDLVGGVANRFTQGGAKFAGFTNFAPGEPVADTTGPITTPINSEVYTVSYRLTVDPYTTAGNYTTTIIYVVVPTF